MNIPGKFATPREFLANLADIEQIAVTRLDEREFDGRKLVGFVLPRNSYLKDAHMLCHVWVDPQTRLPVRYECLPEDPGDLPASFLHYTLTFTFNRPLDASLFRLVPPEGYTLSHEELEIPYRDQLPLPPKDEKLALPVVVPGVGIGGARFGMSLEQVIEVLGPPDSARYHWETTPKEARQADEARQRASKEADEKGLKGPEQRRFVDKATNHVMTEITKRAPNGMFLEYISRGFQLVVFKDQGLIRIFCFSENAPLLRPFTGKTSKGIGVGATMQEIENAYGPPSQKYDDGVHHAGLYYKSLRTAFMLTDGRLRGLSLDKP